MLTSDRHAWGSVARTFHWVVAAAILIEVPAGWIMSRTYGAKDPVKVAWQYWTSNFHHSAGLTILLLAVVRLVWRLANPVPEADAVRPPIERGLGLVTHWLLYALMILIPLSGWAALSALADSPVYGPTHLWFFGSDGFAPGGVVPRIASPVAWDAPTLFKYGNFAAAHRWLLIAGAGLLVLHIAAALRHHFVLRDRTLHRMLRGPSGG